MGHARSRKACRRQRLWPLRQPPIWTPARNIEGAMRRRGDPGPERSRTRIDRAVRTRRHRAVDDGARHPRFLGRMVRAVQAALADPRQGRGRLCRQGREAGQDRRRQGQADRRAVPHPVDPDRLRHLPAASRSPTSPITAPKASSRRRSTSCSRSSRSRPKARCRRPRSSRWSRWASRCWPRAMRRARSTSSARSATWRRTMPTVIGGLARALIAAGETDEAQRRPRRPAGRAGEEARDRAGPARRSRSPRRAGGRTPRPLEARLAANPDDHEARFELAAAKMAAGDRDGAADALLEIIAPRPRVERRRGAQALPPAARSAGPRRPVVERAAAAAVGAALHMSRTLRVPLFPLPGAILFPRSQLPLHIFEPRYREMVRDAIDGAGPDRR